jgi:hypothetical protein
LFCVSAAAGGTMFYRWWRMEEEDRGRVWRLYGWFTALMACGSCFGAVAWAANMLSLVNFFKGNSISDPVQSASLLAVSYSWYSVFHVPYAVEFMCMCAAKLMVLDRMMVFAAQQDEGLQTRWALAGRVVMAVVVLGNAVGLAANAAAAVYYHKAAQAESAATAAYAANYTKDGDASRSLGQEEVQRGGSIASVQSFCEVAVLLLIVVAFAVVGALCRRLLSSRFRRLGVDAGYDAFMATAGSRLRLRMLGTTGFVFVTFVARAAFSTMFAVANRLRETPRESCPDCGECNNIYWLITQWINYTPEFQTIIVLISSPVALLVALWSMTPKQLLQPMKSKSSQQTIAFTVPLMPPK